MHRSEIERVRTEFLIRYIHGLGGTEHHQPHGFDLDPHLGCVLDVGPQLDEGLAEGFLRETTLAIELERLVGCSDIA